MKFPRYPSFWETGISRWAIIHFTHELEVEGTSGNLTSVHECFTYNENEIQKDISSIPQQPSKQLTDGL